MSADDHDELRFSNEYPMIKEAITSQSELLGSTEAVEFSLGSFEEIETRLEVLLEASLSSGASEERVASIIESMEQIRELKERAKLIEQENGNDEQNPLSLKFTVPVDQSRISNVEHVVAMDQLQPMRDMAPLAAKPPVEVMEQSDEPCQIGAPAASSSGGSHSIQTGAASSDDNQLMECPICFDDEIPRSQMRGLLGCDHLYCQDCMDHHWRSRIEEGEVDSSQLTCPEPSCDVSPAEYELQNLCSAETYQKYLQFMVLAQLKKDTNVVWCPNKECAQPIVWDPDQQEVVCPACKENFCFHCRTKWHPGKVCAEVTDVHLSEEDKRFVRFVNKQGNKMKRCPRCKISTEKTSGCNHMTCAQCGHNWCWLCEGDYSGGHYSTGQCAGMQFTQADSLWGAKLKRAGRTAGIAAGCVVAAPLIVAGGAVVLAGGLVALPIVGAVQLINLARK